MMRGLPFVAFLMICLSSSLSFGQPAPTAAQQHFEEGNKAYSLGNFAKAAEEFKAAFDAKPDPVLLFNIAQAYRHGGELSKALFFYKSYLRNSPDASNRAEVAQYIGEIEQQLDSSHSSSSTPQPSSAAPQTKSEAQPLKVEKATPSVTSVNPEQPVAAETRHSRSKRWVWGVVAGAIVVVAVGVGVGIALGTATAPAHRL